MSRATYTTQQFLEAIPGTGGIVTAIARKVGCAWATARKFIDTHPTVQRAYQDECESILDLAEAKVISAIKAGDSQMIRYYLSTKGKRRGYSERHEVSTLNIDVSRLSDEQLRRIADGEDPRVVLATPSAS